MLWCASHYKSPVAVPGTLHARQSRLIARTAPPPPQPSRARPPAPLHLPLTSDLPATSARVAASLQTLLRHSEGAHPLSGTDAQVGLWAFELASAYDAAFARLEVAEKAAEEAWRGWPSADQALQVSDGEWRDVVWRAGCCLYLFYNNCPSPKTKGVMLFLTTVVQPPPPQDSRRYVMNDVILTVIYCC